MVTTSLTRDDPPTPLVAPGQRAAQGEDAKQFISVRATLVGYNKSIKLIYDRMDTISVGFFRQAEVTG